MSRKVKRVVFVVYKDPECYGVWSSSNLILIRGDPAKWVKYKVQTTVLYEFNVLNEQTEELIEVYGSTKKNVPDLFDKARGIEAMDSLVRN